MHIEVKTIDFYARIGKCYAHEHQNLLEILKSRRHKFQTIKIRIVLELSLIVSHLNFYHSIAKFNVMLCLLFLVICVALFPIVIFCEIIIINKKYVCG